jgi:hypothetical protein
MVKVYFPPTAPLGPLIDVRDAGDTTPLLLADKTMQYSARLDAGWDGDTGEISTGAKLTSRLAAPETDDPAARHVIVEDHQEQMEAIEASYS